MVITSQEEVEKMAEILYNPTTIKEVKEEKEKLSLLYENTSGSYIELFEYFFKTKKDICQFWILQMLINITNRHYNSFSQEQRSNFRSALINLINFYLSQNPIKTHVSNKFCQLFINWVKFDFPENCDSLFHQIIALIYKAENDNVRLNIMYLFSQILITFDDDMIKFRHTQGEFEINRSNIIKDYMRLNNIKDIVELFRQILDNWNSIVSLNKKLISNSIKVLSQLIDWNALSLFEESYNIMLKFIYVPEYQGDALAFLNSIINKGMENDMKLDIINKLNINKIISDLLKINLTENSFVNICDLINDLGGFLVNVLVSIKNPKAGNQLISKEMSSFVIELVKANLLYANTLMNFKIQDYSVLLHLADFLTNLIAYLKSNEELTLYFLEELKLITSSTQKILCIPNYIDLRNENAMQYSEEFSKFRSEYIVIYQNLFCLKALKEYLIQILENFFQSISNPNNVNLKLNEIELPFFLLLNLQHSLKDESDNLLVSRVLKCVFQFNYTKIESELILQTFHEILNRYISFYMNDMSLMEYVVNVYMGNKGIYYQNYKFGAKIVQMFIKFIEKTKNLLKPVAKELISAMKTILDSLINDYKNLLILFEYSPLYHGIGILINQKYFDDEAKCYYLKEMFENILSIVKVLGLDGEKFNLMCKILTTFIKSFNNEANQKIKEIYFFYISAIVKEYYPQVQSQNSVKYSIIIILQRLLIILGRDSVGLIDYFLTNEIKYPSEDIFEDVLKLLHNSCQILKVDAKPIIAKNFFYYYELIKQVNVPKSSISDMDKILINFFYNFTKLVNHICLEFVDSFFNGEIEKVNSEELIKYLVLICCEICDGNTKKQTIKNFKLILASLIRLAGLNNNLIHLVDNILTSSFEIFSKLNLGDPIEYSALSDVINIHFTGFKMIPDYFLNFLNNINKSLQIHDDLVKSYLEALNTYDPNKIKNLEIFAKRLLLKIKMLNYITVIFSNELTTMNLKKYKYKIISYLQKLNHICS